MATEDLPGTARLEAIRHRWRGCSAAVYGTARDKAFQLALDDIAYLLESPPKLYRETTDYLSPHDDGLRVNREAEVLATKEPEDTGRICPQDGGVCWSCDAHGERFCRIEEAEQHSRELEARLIAQTHALKVIQEGVTWELTLLDTQSYGVDVREKHQSNQSVIATVVDRSDAMHMLLRIRLAFKGLAALHTPGQKTTPTT